MFSDLSTTGLSIQAALAENYSTMSYLCVTFRIFYNSCESPAVGLVSRLGLQNWAVCAGNWCLKLLQRQRSTM